MKLSDQEIENVLRAAPKPRAPTALRQQLAAQVKLNVPKSHAEPAPVSFGLAGWLRRWWPALAPGSVALVCVAMMVSQELEIRPLRQSNLRLAEQRASLQGTAAKSRVLPAKPGAGSPDAFAAEQLEVARLKERVAQLTVEVAQLEKMQTENDSLRKQPATPGGLTEAELTALSESRARAQSIQCINNLKQIGLATKVWALDNNDTYPPNFLSMSNELNTPKILACPADTNRPVADMFAAYTDANCSYELLAPSGTPTDADRVLAHCPIHGHVGLCDGSVQGEVGKKHPEWLVERNRKLYFVREPAAKPNP